MFSKDEIYRYIEKCHLADGGYFFAQITPSSGLDTCLAIKTLNLLGLKPKNPEAVISFWEIEENEGNLNDLNGLFLAIQSYKDLGYPLNGFEKYKDLLLSFFRNEGFFKIRKYILEKEELSSLDLSIASIYLDILEGESRQVHYLITLLSELGVKFDKKMFVEYVNSLTNDDGGFGSIVGSQASTTYYCLEILNVAAQLDNRVSKIDLFLTQQFQSANYLEEYFWAIKGLALLKKEIPEKKKMWSFLEGCYRGNGGFSRSQFMGISTIEYTYYAVSILKYLENQHLSVFYNK